MAAKVKKVIRTMYITQTTFLKLKAFAGAVNRSMSSVIDSALREYIQRNKARTPKE